MPLHRLSPLGVKNARPGRHCDGRGLWLFISPNPETGQLRKSWVYRYKRDGRERAMGLGSLDDVPLAEAREKAAAARKLFLAGEDPIEVRESARNQKRLTAARAMTFSQCAEAYIAAHHPAWRSARHLRQWNESLRDYVTPILGPLPVQQIDVALVMKVLQPIWLSKTETASRVRQRVEFNSRLGHGQRLSFRRKPGAMAGPSGKSPPTGQQGSEGETPRGLAVRAAGWVPHRTSGAARTRGTGAGVHHPDRHAQRRGAWRTLVRNRFRVPGLDRPSRAHQGA